MTFFETRDYVREYLIGQGYQPEAVNEKNLIFKREGQTLCVILDKDDTEFFRVLLPCIDSINEETSEEAVNFAISETDAKIKVARIIRQENDVHVIAELFYENAEAFTKIMERTITSCLAARLYYCAMKMKFTADETPSHENE